MEMTCPSCGVELVELDRSGVHKKRTSFLDELFD